MAKATTAKAPKAKKKAAKVMKAAPKKAKSNAADTLWKLTDHPLVGELIAIGASAAVAAIAQQGLGKDKGKRKKNGSNKAVKEAGKAAAAAIGARLISEFAEARFETESKSAKS